MLILQNRRDEGGDLTCWRKSEDWLGEVKGLVEGDEGIDGRKMGGEKLGVLFLEREYGGT